MRRNQIFAAVALSGFGMLPAAFAQMHKVAKPEDVVRAVGVYEWTGDRLKPTASRLVPVTVFIDGSLEDAGEYLARPVPFALDTGNVYEIDKAGAPEGILDLQFARHLKAPDNGDAAVSYDDGWFGYGTFLAPKPPKKVAALKPSKNTAAIVSSKDAESDRPTFSHKGDTTAPAATPASSKDSTAPAAPADDPDRPHMTRKPETTDTKSSTTQDTSATPDSSADKGSGTPGPAPANDPDRPTLRRRTPEEAKRAKKEAQESSASGLATSLNDDPNRPTLHHGNGQQALAEDDIPKLKGLPVGLHQAVAVSDAKTRPEHDFSRPWADDAERAAVLGKMQALAQAKLAAYIANGKAPAPTAAPAKPGQPNSKLRRKKVTESANPAIPLVDEQLSGYTLSYGGAATYVYMARTDGEAANLRYVTIVAQRDVFGELQPAIQSVTDAAHLDRTPWMRLVDVVDVDASNRASLLFELRGESARQFGLYRVIASRSEQVFLTGTTQ